MSQYYFVCMGPALIHSSPVVHTLISHLLSCCMLGMLHTHMRDGLESKVIFRESQTGYRVSEIGFWISNIQYVPHGMLTGITNRNS